MVDGGLGPSESRHSSLSYHKQQLWGGTASVLLRKEPQHLCLLELSGMDLATSTFDQSVLRAWSTVLKVRRDCSPVYGSVGEEPLFDNPSTHCRILCSTNSHQSWSHKDSRSEVWGSVEDNCQEANFKSLRLMEKLLAELVTALPGPFCGGWAGC